MDLLPPPPPALVINFDRGGIINKYIASLKTFKADHRVIEVRGYCGSACTIYMDSPNFCIGPEAQLVFHEGSWSLFDENDNPVTYLGRSEEGTWLMWKHYPRRIQNWIRNRGGLTAQELVLKGSKLRSFFKACL